MKDLSVDEIILEITKMRKNGEVYPDGLFTAEVGGELSKASIAAAEREYSHSNELAKAGVADREYSRGELAKAGTAGREYSYSSELVKVNIAERERSGEPSPYIGVAYDTGAVSVVDSVTARTVPLPLLRERELLPVPAAVSDDFRAEYVSNTVEREIVRIEGGFDGDDYDSIVRKWKKSDRAGITITDVDLPVIRDGGAVHAARDSADDDGGNRIVKYDTLTKPPAFAADNTLENERISDEYGANDSLMYEELNPLENGMDGAAVRNTKDFDNVAVKPTTQPLSLIPGTITEEITAASELKRERGEKRRRGSTGLIESVISRKAGHLPATNKFNAVGAVRRRLDKDIKLNINKHQVVHTGDVPEITLTDTNDNIAEAEQLKYQQKWVGERAANKKLANRILNGGAVPTAGIGGTDNLTAELENTSETSETYETSQTGEAETEFFTPDVGNAKNADNVDGGGETKVKHRHKPKHDDDKAVSDTLDEMYREISFKTVAAGIITALLFIVEIYNTVVRPVFQVQISLPLLSFVDKVINPVGYIMTNIILGVIAAVLCHGVFMCLFRPNRGGERLTALIIVAAILAAIPAVVHFDLVQRGFAFIYIPAAVFLLFCDTLKKRGTILTMKRNFRLVYGENAKYYGFCVADTETARLLAKGFEDIHVPNVAVTRRTAYLTHFLNNGFSPDITDTHGNRHAAVSFVLAVLAGAAAHFAPFIPPELRNDLVYSASVFAATFIASMPVLLMFSVCGPLGRGATDLLQYKAMVGGYSAAETFSKVNVAALDAMLLFPNDTIKLESVKPYTTRNGLNDVSLNEAMIIAASVAIQSGSVMSHMFDEIINGDRSVLRRIDEIIYEENMGVTGWAEQRRVFFGNDLLMKRHEINVPSVEALRRGKKNKRNNTEIVYLALGGDVVAAFGLKITANVEVAESLRRLQRNNIAIAVRTGDSIVTSAQLAHMFQLDDRLVRVISFNAHERFRSTVKYTTTGNCGVVCDGSLSSFSAGISASKLLVRDIHRTGGLAYFAAAVGLAVFALCALVQADMGVATSAGLVVYNLGCCALARVVFAGRRYM